MGGRCSESCLFSLAGNFLTVNAEWFLTNLLTQCQNRVNQGLGTGRAPRQVDVDGNDVIASLNDGVVVEHAAR